MGRLELSLQNIADCVEDTLSEVNRQGSNSRRLYTGLFSFTTEEERAAQARTKSEET